MNICIIGTGYVGLVTGASLAYLGNKVTCVDIDQRKIDQLKKGKSPIYEPGLDQLLAAGIKARNLLFTDSLEEAASDAEIIYIAVGTPPNADGTPDLTAVKAAAKGIGKAIVANYRKEIFRIVINKSTVPVGSGNWVEMLVREQIRQVISGADFGREVPEIKKAIRDKDLVSQLSETFAVVSNPEFLREGTALEDTFFPDRIVVGASNPKAFDILSELYQPLIDQNFKAPDWIAPRPVNLSSVRLLMTDLTSAEMIKYAANSFLAMKISFANEIANICEQTGADIKEVTTGIGLDQRIGSRFLNAGIGWGGSCFGKDVSALIEIAREYGYEPQLLESARQVNLRQRQLAIQKLQGSLRIIKGKTIGLLGLAFKPDTDDVRDAPSFDLARALLKMGAHVKAYDPVATKNFQDQHPELEMVYANSVEDLAAECDAIVVVTEWDEFRTIDPARLYEVMKGNLLVDGRNIFDPIIAGLAGFRYLSYGRNTEIQSKKSYSLRAAA